MSKAPVCVDDFEQYAKRYLPKIYWEYYSGGSDAQITLKESKNAFKRYRDLRVRELTFNSLFAGSGFAWSRYEIEYFQDECGC